MVQAEEVEGPLTEVEEAVGSRMVEDEEEKEEKERVMVVCDLSVSEEVDSIV